MTIFASISFSPKIFKLKKLCPKKGKEPPAQKLLNKNIRFVAHKIKNC